MTPLLHTTRKGLDRLARGARSHRLLLGMALGLFVAVAAVAFSAPEARADPRDFTLVNNSNVVIWYVYVSRTSTDDWGEDVLGRDVLLPGDWVDITFTTQFSGWCNYDIKVVGSHGEEGFMWNVDLCSTTTVTFS